MKKTILFKDIKTISFHFKISNKESKYIVLYFKDNLKNYKNDFVIDKSKNYINLKSQNGLCIDQDNNLTKYYSTTKIQYNELIQGKHNYEILNIFNEIKPFSRNYIKIHSLNNLPIKKNEFKNFEISYLEKDDKNNVILFNQNTYYDLNKKETIIGFNENSNNGYVVPYDYSGIFYPYLLINFNLYTNLKISWNVDLPKPYYFKEVGIVKFNINDNNENENNKSQDWDEIDNATIKEGLGYKFARYDDFIKWLKEKNKWIKEKEIVLP